jgi:uncharacterized protein YjbI with pentapeptide repeats
MSAGVSLLVVLTTGIASSTAFADSIVDGCTIVSTPTATSFTRRPGANLRGVTSTCVSLDFGDGIGVVPFCGGVSMPNSNLHNADLTGDDLSFAFLPGANLSGAHLSLLLPDFGVLPTNLARADLRGANLRGADLTGRRSRARTSRAHTSTAPSLPEHRSPAPTSRTRTCSGPTSRGATLTGVIWFHTTCPDGTNSNRDGGTCANNL